MTQAERRKLLEECCSIEVSSLTALKVCTNREYHREAALEGCERARKYLEQEYPGWGNMSWNEVPKNLRDARIEALADQETFAAISQLLPDPNNLPANAVELYSDAIAQGYFTNPLVMAPTASQLAKADGLTPKGYLSFIQSERGAEEAAHWGFIQYDWSLTDETMVDAYRKSLRVARPRDASGNPLPAIHQEKGKSSTIGILRSILNALVIHRLLGRGDLSIPDAIRALENAHIKPPYSQNREQRWRDAQRLAYGLLKELKAGRFNEALMKLVATRQARKIRLPQ